MQKYHSLELSTDDKFKVIVNSLLISGYLHIAMMYYANRMVIYVKARMHRRHHIIHLRLLVTTPLVLQAITTMNFIIRYTCVHTYK